MSLLLLKCSIEQVIVQFLVFNSDVLHIILTDMFFIETHQEKTLLFTKY